MDIKTAIKQKKPFANDYHKAAVNIMYTNSWIMGHLRILLEPYDITPQQYNVLRILQGSKSKPLSTLDIRERMLDKMSDVSRIIFRLVDKKLVKKALCKFDKRLVDIKISTKGTKLLALIANENPKINKFSFNLTKEEAAKLSDLLDKLRTQ